MPAVKPPVDFPLKIFPKGAFCFVFFGGTTAIPKKTIKSFLRFYTNWYGGLGTKIIASQRTSR
jgi:hypothetical protein